MTLETYQILKIQHRLAKKSHNI